MNLSRLSLAAVLLLAFAPAAHAEGKWVLRPALGESFSDGAHGSTAEAQLIAEVKPDLWLGLEGGLSYVKVVSAGNSSALESDAGHVVSGITDGITRNREFFLGPMVRWGSAVYALASYGLADVVGGGRGTTDYLQGGSLGVGIGGSGRMQPSAELRYRWVSEGAGFRPSGVPGGDALTFTLGVHVR